MVQIIFIILEVLAPIVLSQIIDREKESNKFYTLWLFIAVLLLGLYLR